MIRHPRLIPLALAVLATLPTGAALAADAFRPAAFQRTHLKRLDDVQLKRMAAIDVQALKAEDARRAQQHLPPRFAAGHDVTYTPANAGTWEDLDTEHRVWRMRVQSRGALSLNFGFTRYRMPEGGRLMVYPADMTPQTATADRLRTCRFQRILDPGAAPLLAIREFIISRKSMGGLQTDLECRVLDHDGAPIPGLYAAGESAGFGGGGMNGQRGLEGTFLGGCLLGGRIAGQLA